MKVVANKFTWNQRISAGLPTELGRKGSETLNVSSTSEFLESRGRYKRQRKKARVKWVPR